MKRTLSLLMAALTLGGCAATTTITEAEHSEVPTLTEPAVVPDTATGSEPTTRTGAQESTRLSTPVSTDVVLDLDDVSISTTSYALTFDKGTEWEIPLAIAVPEGWAFDPERPGFSDGASSITLIADCAGACEIKGWTTALNADGQFFDVDQLFADDASLGFFGGASERGDVAGTSATRDDGSGVSLTAHTRHDVGRFVGCTGVSVAGSTTLDQLTELCKAIEVDWSVAAASTPEYVIVERLTEAAAAAISNPAPGLTRQTFSVDGHGLISIALPPGSTVTEDGDEIELAATESIFSDLELDATCDGACGPQNWVTKLQEADNTIGRTRLRLDLVNDSPIDGGWLLSGSEGEDHVVLVARWNDQSERFFICEASIDSRDLDLIDDMLNICLSTEPDWSTW